MRLLIAEEDTLLGETLAFAARRRGHRVALLASVGEVFERLPFEPTAVAVGLQADAPEAAATAARVRSRFPGMPFVVTVERPPDSLTRSLVGAGVDDIVRIPYDPVEVVLKLEVAEARGADDATPDRVRVGDLDILLPDYLATKNEQRLELTRLEFRLLYCLCIHYPNLAPMERLVAFAWDRVGDPEGALVKSHLSHLRRKLNRAGGTRFEIRSRHGLGYTLVVGEEEGAGPSEAPNRPKGRK